MNTNSRNWGPIGLGNPIQCLEEGGNPAIGTRKLNTGFNGGNSNIGLAKTEIDAKTVLGEHPGDTTTHKPSFLPRKTYSALLNRLRQIEAKPESRKYKSTRLTERTLKPTSMYQTEVASIANIRHVLPQGRLDARPMTWRPAHGVGVTLLIVILIVLALMRG